MRVDTILLTTVLFVASIPGVVVKLGSGWTGLFIHGVIFSVLLHVGMRAYHRYVIVREGFGNYGPTCPNGYQMGADQVCRPTGHATASVNTGFRSGA